MSQKIKVNKVKCLTCNDIIESENEYDQKKCSCGNVTIHGGKKKLGRMRVYGTRFEELSEYE